MGRRSLTSWFACLIWVAVCRAQTSAPTAPPTFDPQRLNELVTLIEGANPPAARRTGAKELLRQHWAEAVPRLTEILAGKNRPARVAVALALTELPEFFEAGYSDPLLAMLADTEAEQRDAAGAALAAAMRPDLIPRLRKIMLESDVLTARLAAIETLGSMTSREAAAALMDALEDPGSPICQPALTALTRATTIDFQSDPGQALIWWKSVRDLPPERWLQAFGDRLVRQNRALAGRIRELEGRLTTVLRENLLRASDADRVGLLKQYLSDPSPTARVLALEVLQASPTEGKQIPAEIVTRVRELSAATDLATRSAAIRTMAAVGDAADVPTLLQLLNGETRAGVRQALANAFGYLGGSNVVEAVMELLADRDASVAGEAATALGRCAERGVLDGAGRESAAGALLTRWQATAPSDAGLQERLLTAMGRLEDARFLPVFCAALDATHPAALRLAAVRGLSVLAGALNGRNEPQSQPAASSVARAPAPAREQIADPLLRTLTDNDAGVRKAAVDAFCTVAGGDGHLQALWSRLASGQESDEAIRTALWRGVLKLMATRSPREIDGWIDRLTDTAPLRQQRSLDLLGVEEKALQSAGAGRAELGLLHARVGELRAAIGRPADAIDAYLAAVDDLQAAKSPAARKAALDLIKLAIFLEAPDPRVAAAVSAGQLGLNAKLIWDSVRPEIETRLKMETIDGTVLALKSFLADPLLPLDADTFRSVDGLNHRALELQSQFDNQRVQAGLSKLHDNTADETARGAILQMGERATPHLRQMLRTQLSNGTSDPALEKVLYDLIKQLQPDWSGYPIDAPPAEKLKALEPPTV